MVARPERAFSSHDLARIREQWLRYKRARLMATNTPYVQGAVDSAEYASYDMDRLLAEIGMERHQGGTELTE